MSAPLRIEVLTQDDPLYIFPFFEEFLRNYRKEFNITRISSSPAMGKRSRRQMIKELAELYGVAGFMKLAFERTKAKILGRIPARKNALRFYTVAQLCRAYGIEHQEIGNPNDDEFVVDIEKRAPDVLISVACPYILKERLLNAPRLGCLNIHHAPLPRYKGMMPTFWQMYQGEKSVGVTVHAMVRKIDEGNIYLQDTLAIIPGESLDTLIRRSKRHGAHCMAKVLSELGTGTHKVITLDGAESSYFTFPNKDEIKEFKRRGNRAI